jgi:hypothetical protein
VPKRLVIHVGSGSVLLDFRQAVIATPELRVDLKIASGDLRLITRPGVVVDADRVTVHSGTVRVRVPPPEPGSPVQLRVILSGSIGSGSLSARPARRNWFLAWLQRLFGRPAPA